MDSQMEFEFTQESNLLTDKKILQYFSKLGYVFRPKAFQDLKDFLGEQPDHTSKQVLNLITNSIKEMNNADSGRFSNFIDQHKIEKAIKFTVNLIDQKIGNGLEQEKDINEKQKENYQDNFKDLKNFVNSSILQCSNKPLNNRFKERDFKTKATPQKITTPTKTVPVVNIGLKDKFTEILNNSLIMLDPFVDCVRFEDVFCDRQSRKSNVVQKQLNSTKTEKDSRIMLFHERLELIKFKMQRSPKYIFKHQINSKMSITIQGEKSIYVTEVSSLLGTKGKKSVLGLLLSSGGNTYCLENDTARVSLCLKPGIKSVGFINSGFIVIATGYYEEALLTVEKFELPDIETINQSKVAFSSSELWHFEALKKLNRTIESLLNLEQSRKKLKQVQEVENVNKLNNIQYQILNNQKHLGIFDLRHNQYFMKENLQEYCILTFSNFKLDNMDVLNNFEKILSGIQDNLQPLVFILIGNFFSVFRVSNAQENQVIENGVDAFLEILNKYKFFKDHCYWIMVPGMNDLGLSCTPRKPFPESYFHKLYEEIPFFINATNPARFTLLDVEITISQMNLLKEFRRGQIVKPKDDISQEKHLVKSIFSQSHLVPRNFYQQPINYNLDHALRLYKLPHFCILADGDSENFYQTLGQGKGTTNVINPGNFEKNKTFYILHPFEKKQDKVVQECQI